jgi:hypothetical protein
MKITSAPFDMKRTKFHTPQGTTFLLSSSTVLNMSTRQETLDEVKPQKVPDEKVDSQKAGQNKDAGTAAKPSDPNAPVKVRKKPGRKPNPQSPAIRK